VRLPTKPQVVLLNRSDLVLQFKDGSMAADVGGASTPSYLTQRPIPLTSASE
jgi:hypothetical protein